MHTSPFSADVGTMPLLCFKKLTLVLKGVVSKETVMLRRYKNIERITFLQKYWVYQRS